jgi:tRNA(Ile)-lysidine synthetase-like protein
MYASSLWKRWKKTGEIPAETFFKKSEFERLWYLRLLWKELYGDTKECYRAHLYEVDKALQKKGKKEFGKVWWILREGKEIRVQEKRAKTITPATEVLHEGVPCLWGGVLWTWKREKTLPKKAQKPHILFLSSSTPIQCMVRAKKEGDRFHPLGAPGTKKVSDFLREQGIPVSKRTTVPLWQNQKGDILGVGLMPDERYKVKQGQKYYYSIAQTIL